MQRVSIFLFCVLTFVVLALSSCEQSMLDQGSANNSPTSSSDSVVGLPTITAQFIENTLTTNGSPASGTGYSLYNYGVQYGIDPAFALAFFLQESTYGKYGVARGSLSLGNIRCIPNTRCVNNFAYFNSWQDGYAAWYDLIANLYVKQWGLTTVGQITQKYAPPEDGNDPYGYAQTVEATVQAYRKGV